MNKTLVASLWLQNEEYVSNHLIQTIVQQNTANNKSSFIFLFILSNNK